MNEQLMLFPENRENDLEVCKVTFNEIRYSNYKELFDGFSHLYAVTFSYGLDFIEEISEYFSTVDVILGCEGIVKYDAKEIMSFQEKSLILINKHKQLIKRVVAGDVQISMLKELISHEKFYILTDDFGNSRIITGSANFSGKAFKGKQREGIFLYENDAAAYEYFVQEFEFLQDFATNSVTLDSIYSGDKEDIDIEDLPVVKEAKIKDVGIIVDNEGCNSEEVEFITDVSAISARKYSKLNIKTEKEGTTTFIRPAAIHSLIRQQKENRKIEQQKKKAYPQFIIDYDKYTFSLNGNQYSTETNMDNVKSDLMHINLFFDGFKNFIGYNEQNITEYYKLLNYMFLSPFIAKLRSLAFVTDYSEEYFPYYVVLNGKKSSGKSTLVETIHHIMFGRKLGRLNDSVFVKTRMTEYLLEAKGVPCLIDDISRTRLNEGESFIKSDEWLRKDQYINHPVFILTSNQIDTIKPELAKRIIFLAIDMTQENTVAVLKKKKLADNLKQVTTSFYCEYLRRMIPHISHMIEIMENSLVKEDYEVKQALDIFNISSTVIKEIYEDCNVMLPEGYKVFTYDDYFGYNTIMANIKEKILLDWKHNKNAFRAFRKTNALEYSNCEKPYEAERIKDSLPERLEARRSGLKIIMKLDEAEKFFGVKFKNKVWFDVR